MRTLAGLGLIVLLLGVASASISSPRRFTAVERFDAFGREVRRSGRATADLRLENQAEPGARPTPSRLMLAWPDRARLDFPTTRECIVLRDDGGEWLQPRLRQMVRLGVQRAREAQGWWHLLVPADSGRTRSVALADDRLLLIRDGMEPESAWVGLDRGGRPSWLRWKSGAEEISCRFQSWKLARNRGETDFHLTAPIGFETVDLK